MMSPSLSQFYLNRFGNLEEVVPTPSSIGLPSYHQVVGSYRVPGMTSSLTREARGVGAQALDQCNAMQSLLGEALERMGARFTPLNNESLVGCYDELSKRYPLLPLSYYNIYSEVQRSDYRRRYSEEFPMKSLQSESNVEWMKGYSLCKTGLQETLQPIDSFLMPANREEIYEMATTNGYALGANSTMAFKNGLFEAVERSAFLQCWWSQSAPPQVAIEELMIWPFKQEFRNLLQIFSHRITVLDLTDIFGIPTFSCCLRGKENSAEPALVVSGASSSSILSAIEKAVLEGVRIFDLIFNSGEHFKYFDSGGDPEKVITTFNERLLYYAQKTNASKAQFLFEGTKVSRQVLENKIGASIDCELKTSEIVDRVLEKTPTILYFDLTPLDLKLAGLSLQKVILPYEIPIDAQHVLRPLGHPKLSSMSHTQINPNPHPYC